MMIKSAPVLKLKNQSFAFSVQWGKSELMSDILVNFINKVFGKVETWLIFKLSGSISERAFAFKVIEG